MRHLAKLVPVVCGALGMMLVMCAAILFSATNAWAQSAPPTCPGDTCDNNCTIAAGGGCTVGGCNLAPGACVTCICKDIDPFEGTECNCR